MLKYLSATTKQKLKGTALLRLDFNTEDTWRLEASLPTVRYLLRTARAIVILSHRGRPQGVTIKNGVPSGAEAKKLSLQKNAAVLKQLLKRKVIFVPHFRFDEIQRTIAAAPRGSIFLLENMRFLPGEAADNASLGKTLASLGDYFVNDAFAVSHRANASLVAITKYVPSYAGLELEQEITHLGGILRKPKHPFVILVGGAKAHEKDEVMKYFKNKADTFLLGGEPANTMLSLRGVNVKGSLVDHDPKDLVILRQFLRNPNVVLPSDWNTQQGKIFDIGERTIKGYVAIIHDARTVLWAGPMGFIEKRKFEKGSLAIAKAITKNRDALSITGGGETVMLLKKYKLDKKFSFISTGGGAMLEFLAGKKLPAIEALR
jgi:3-phosphoglycerate kinase